LDNAIKFTKNGFIKLILDKNINDEIILEIKDTGIGINDEYLEHLFEPYRQEHMGYGRAYDGIGLGLAIVNKIVTLNNASINVISKKGEGTTFSINFGKEVIPINNISEIKTDANIIPLSRVSQNKLVLIVEDDWINQITIKKFINKKYKSITTDSSEEVFEILKNNKVDLVLMDILIKGGKNGLELTKELKASKEFSHIPVIAVTAHAFEEDKQNALRAGCDNYLAKPFSRQNLLDIVELHLNKTILAK
jgi:two-component system, sensor histidine kinase